MSSPASEVAYLARALKMPRIPTAAKLFAERARDEGWDYEAFLAAVLTEETNQREVRGSDARIKAARFPQIKTLDDFDFTFQRSVKRQTIAHLAQLDFLVEAHNVVFLGPPGPARPIVRLKSTTEHPSRPRLVSAAAGMTPKSHWLGSHPMPLLWICLSAVCRRRPGLPQSWPDKKPVRLQEA